MQEELVTTFGTGSLTVATRIKKLQLHLIALDQTNQMLCLAARDAMQETKLQRSGQHDAGYHWTNSVRSPAAQRHVDA